MHALRNNNFDLLRLMAAYQVVVGHVLRHLHPIPEGAGDTFTWIIERIPGVPIFFVISGFLIAFSYRNSASLRRYSTNRFLRIYPGLWLCFACTLALLVSFGKIDGRTLASKEFWDWIGAQLTIGQYFNPAFLRHFGVGVINGSLWTIPVELEFYMTLPLLFWAGGRMSPRARKAGFVALFTLSFGLFSFLGEEGSRSVLWVKLLGVSVLPHLFEFMFGMIAFACMDRLPRYTEGRALYWLSAYFLYHLAFAALGRDAWNSPIGTLVGKALLAVTTLSVAYSWRSLSSRLLRGNDISYGIYIYHMLWVNAALVLGLGHSWMGASIVFVGVTVTAWLSWTLVEKPALRLKERGSRKPAAVRTAPSSSTLLAVVIGLACLCLNARPSEAAGMRMTPGPMAFPRGQPAVFHVEVSGADRIQVAVDRAPPEERDASSGETTIEFGTASLPVGSHQLDLTALAGGQEVARTHVVFHVGPPRDPDRYPLWRWGETIGQSETWVALGFNGGILDRYDAMPSAAAIAKARHTLDRAVELGHDQTLYLHPSLSPRWKGKGVLSGKLSRERVPNPLDPEVIAYSEDLTRRLLQVFGPYPAVTSSLINSEWAVPFSDGPQVAELAAHLSAPLPDQVLSRNLLLGGWTLPGPAPGETEDGIVPRDSARYRFLDFWWRHGNGLDALNQRMSDIIHAARPDIMTWHDPWRLAPVAPNSRLDLIGTWTHPWPDLRWALFTPFLQAAARDHGKGVLQTISMYIYPRWAIEGTGPGDEAVTANAGGDSGFFHASADQLRISLWLALSQRPDVLAVYSVSAGRPEPTATQSPTIWSPGSFEAVRDFVDRALKPLGPALRASQRHASRAAIVLSAAGEWFARRSESLPLWTNDHVMPFAIAFATNHVQFDVLLDDQVTPEALAHYRLVVFPRSEAVTAAMRDAIAGYVKSGGKVLANEPFPRAIGGVTRVDLKFAELTRLDGTKPKPITAEAARDLLEERGRQLAAYLGDDLKLAKADTPRALIGTLQGGEALWHIVVNTDMTYGPRFKKYRLIFENGVPQRARISFRADAGTAIYDATARRRLVPGETNDGWLDIGLDLPAANGAVILQLPRPIASVAVDVPTTAIEGSRVTARFELRDADHKRLRASLPVLAELIEPDGRPSDWSRNTTTHAADDGRGTFSFTVGRAEPTGEWILRLTDLASGIATERTIQINPR
ncbi:MAG: acyltransferase family protein [Proteobacteria bacterium]|nr:acyltransferase family protein [Pseudomonadota bacterium]